MSIRRSIAGVVMIVALMSGSIPAQTDELGQGVMLLNQGDYDGAIVQLLAALKKNPSSFKAAMGLGNAYFLTDDYDKAVVYFEKAHGLNPADVGAASNLATVYTAQGKSDKALELYTQVVKSNPGNAEPYNGLGAIEQSLGNYDKAIAQYKKAISLVQTEARYYVNLGKVYELMNNAGEAALWYEKALTVNGKSVEAILALGVLDKNASQYEKARAHFQQVLQINPSSWEAQRQLGILLEIQGSLDGAINRYNQALKSGKADLREVLSALGAVYAKKGDFESAAASYRQLLIKFPALDEIHGELGVVLFRSGNFFEAVQELKKGLQQDSANIRFLSALGDAYMALQRYDMAVACYEDVLKTEPDHIPARLQLGILAYNKADYNRAEKYLRGVLAINPATVDAGYYVALILIQRKRFDEAITMLEELKSYAGSDARVFYGLGMAYGRLNNLQKAVEMLTKAVSLNDKLADAHWELAKIYEQTNYRDMQYKELRKILEIDKNHPLKASIKAKLQILRDDGIIKNDEWQNF